MTDNIKFKTRIISSGMDNNIENSADIDANINTMGINKSVRKIYRLR